MASTMSQVRNSVRFHCADHHLHQCVGDSRVIGCLDSRTGETWRKSNLQVHSKRAAFQPFVAPTRSLRLSIKALAQHKADGKAPYSFDALNFIPSFIRDLVIYIG